MKTNTSENYGDHKSNDLLEEETLSLSPKRTKPIVVA